MAVAEGRAGAARPATPPHWWSRPEGRVALLTALLGAAGVAVVGLLAGGGVTPPRAADAGWLPVLAVAFAATEGFVIHVRVRRGGHAMSLGEIPMVLGLLSFDPLLVVLARLIGGGAGLLLVRRQRGAKLLFNLALLVLQSAVAAAVLRLVAGPAVPHAGGVRDWLATYAAMLAADVVAVVAVTAVIALHDDPGEWRRLPAAMRSVGFVAVTTTIGLLSQDAARADRWSLLLLAALCVVLFLAYRAYVRRDHGRAEVAQLYAFTRALDGVTELDELVPVVLDRVRDQLRAGVAELVLPARDGVARYRFSGHGATELGAGLTPDDAWWDPALAGRPARTDAGAEPDGMAVPLNAGDGDGVLLVTGSLPDSGSFGDDGLHLLQAMANHAAMALAKANLVHRLRREVAEKEHLALFDTLTGLPNRRHFHQLLDGALGGGAGGGIVLLLDVDRFKEVNDALGHETGDGILTEVASRLRQHVNGSGVAARLGGDEFAVWLPGDGTDPLARAAGVAAVVERTVPIGPLTVDVRVSIGVAVAPGHGTDAQTLVRRADVAMYEARGQRAGVRLYDPTADRNTPQRLARIADLRSAIEERDLGLMYQPKVDPASGRVVGAEALARWHHPIDGPVPPDEFIPLAEHSGLIRPLTLHVLEVALRSRGGWARAGHDLHVAVNLSPNSLLDDGLPEVIARLLASTGTAPGALTLEITESTLMADPERSAATLHRLHALGLKLSIDDFGTGYSSLGRLRHLPIDEVKIDRSFVQRLAADHRDRAVVRSAIQLGHALELKVVAEGVEDADSQRYLAAEGCDLVQGYHVSRPLAPEAFADWLAQSSSPLHRVP